MAPRRRVVQSVSVGSRLARSSGNSRAAPGYVQRFTATARVRYTLDGQDYGTVAAGWDVPFLEFARREASRLEPGQAIAVRVNPETPTHATLLGSVNRHSVAPILRPAATELLALVAIVACGRDFVRNG